MTVTWSLENSKTVIIDPSEHGYERRDEMSEKRTVSSLRIRSAARKDSTVFTCSVSNLYGSDSMNQQLIVQEVPEAPRDLKLIQSTSRTAKLSWSIPFNGNNQILKYWITCFTKETFNQSSVNLTNPSTSSSGQRLEFNSIDNRNVLSSDRLKSSSQSSLTRDGEEKDGSMAAASSHQQSTSMTSSSNIHVSVDFNPTNDQSWTLIRGVKPATNYYCFIRAENEIGLSPLSHRLEIQTEEEGKERDCYCMPCSVWVSVDQSFCCLVVTRVFRGRLLRDAIRDAGKKDESGISFSEVVRQSGKIEWESDRETSSRQISENFQRNNNNAAVCAERLLSRRRYDARV